MIKNKITVKEILEDRYFDFKNKYWDKVPKRMREQIDATVNKAIKCSDSNMVLLNMYVNNVVKVLNTTVIISLCLVKRLLMKKILR